MKNLILSIFLLISTITFAQQKLTLEDAVLQQGRKFRADRLQGFQWVPNSQQYVFFGENGKKLMTADTKNSIGNEKLFLKDINGALSTDVKSFYGIEFVNDDNLFLSSANKYYNYNIKSKTGKMLAQIDSIGENITVSPDKNNFAYTVKNNFYIQKAGNAAVAVTNEKNDAIVSGQFFARSEFGISGGIFWSPKSTHVAFYQKDQTEVADYPLLNINTTPGTVDPIKYPMIGQKSEKPRVGIYDIANNKTVYISPMGKSDDYLTNLSWTPDGKYVIIAELNRQQNNMHLNLFDATTGKLVRTLIEESDDAWVEPEHPAFFPNKNSDDFIWISEKDGFNNLYQYSIDGKLLKKLTNNNFMLKEIIGSSPDGKEIFFTATGINPTNTLLYKVDLKGKQTLITQDLGTHNVSMSTDRKYIFDEFSNHTTQSKSLLYDVKGKSTTLLESKNKYDGYTIGTSDIGSIKAADGKTDLITRLIKPSNFDPSIKYPVLVYVYGGPHAQMITNSYLDGASLWMYWMAEQGYLVFTVDNRGSANRGVEFEKVIHGQVGNIEIADQIKGVEYLKSLPYVDGKRLAIHGWSFGGFMTVSMMLRQPGVFNVGVAGGPVTDWKYYEAMYGERYMDTPAENPKGFEESSTLNYVKNLQGKLLLIHGTIDDVVVMQHGEMLLKKFIEAEKQVDFFAYPMHKHNVMGKDRVHLMTKVLDYVIENNR